MASTVSFFLSAAKAGCLHSRLELNWTRYLHVDVSSIDAR
jgi:hypothetical protein